MAGNETLTPSGMYTSDPHPAAPFPEPERPHPAPHRQGRYTNGLFIRFTSRSLPTPTMNGSYSLKRFRPREFQELEIRNISFMASRDNGSGQSKQLIIGAIILTIPYIIATTLSRTISWRMLRLLVTRHDHRPSRLWLRNYLNPCRLLRHLGNLVISGEWLNA